MANKISNNDQSNIPDYAMVAWGLRDGRNKNDPQKLNIKKIVDAAISIANTDGLEGLSIRKLSKQLHFTTMAVYRHVVSRDELIILMVDATLGTPPSSVKGALVWQSALRNWGQALLANYQAHPWLLDAPTGGMPTTPNNVLWLEYILEGMKNSRLSLQQTLDCALLVDGHARNFANLTRQTGVHTTSYGDNPPDSSWLASLVSPGTYPYFSQVFTQGVLEDAETEGPDFAFGLDRIISGIEVFITTQ